MHKLMTPQQIPNILTIIRILLVIPFAFSVYRYDFTQALIIFFIAGLSDGIDGFLARQFNWKSRFGAIADPLADKLLLTVAYVMLTLTENLPLWLMMLVLGRDLIIVIGALIYHYLISHFEIKPTLLGKSCTLIQILYVLLVIMALAGLPIPKEMIDYGLYAVALITALSGLHYLVFWGLKAISAIRSKTQND